MQNKEKIFCLEERGGIYFFLYNLSSLYYILHKKDNCEEENDNTLIFPIKIHMKNILQFHRETFEILKDKFVLIEDLSDIDNYKIISMYGETHTSNSICDNPHIIYPFIRELFLEKMKYDIIPKKRIYITRKNSESQHHGCLKRMIINEEEVYDKLKKYNFEYIQLEDYNMYEKIKLFMESEVILSSNSGALTLLLFANIKTKIIEIVNRGFPHNIENQYYDISKTLGLNYNRYSKINEDYYGNFILDFNEFEKYLINIL